MTPLQESFLSLIRSALWSSEFKCEEGVTAQDLYKEAERYNILPILSTKIDVVCASDPETRAKWSKVAFANYIKMSKFLILQEELCNLLATIDVKPVFLKGLASAYYYPDPLLRSQDDIDFIVPPEQFDKTLELMLRSGYEEKSNSPRHAELIKQGVEFELHHQINNCISDFEINIDALIKNSCKSCINKQINAHNFYALPDEIYGFELLEHLIYHLPNGAGFRQLLDWVLYVNSVVTDVLYNSKSEKKLQENNLDRFAKIITKTSIMFLGLPADNKAWCLDADDDTCREFIEFILGCNNWGVVNGNSTISYMQLIMKTKSFGVIKRCISRASFNYPNLWRTIVLRPIACVLQLGFWIKTISKGISLDSNLMENKRKAEDRSKLFEDIGLYRDPNS